MAVKDVVTKRLEPWRESTGRTQVLPSPGRATVSGGGDTVRLSHDPVLMCDQHIWTRAKPTPAEAADTKSLRPVIIGMEKIPCSGFHPSALLPGATTPDGRTRVRIININGVTDNPCKCGSWLEHWKKYSGQTLPTHCPEETCTQAPEIGSHVQKNSLTDRSWYIVPLCHRCNGKTGESLEISDHITLVAANVALTCGKSALAA